jgi:hypothetical protein
VKLTYPIDSLQFALKNHERFMRLYSKQHESTEDVIKKNSIMLKYDEHLTKYTQYLAAIEILKENEV